VVRTTGNRFGCNTISALTRGSIPSWYSRRNFTTKVFLQFLDRILKQHPGKIYLIVDGHGVHRVETGGELGGGTKKAQSAVSTTQLQPRTQPGRARQPEREGDAVGRKRARTVDELMSNVRWFLRGRQNSLRQVRRYFRGRHVAYAA
jgi:hypothetical protein